MSLSHLNTGTGGREPSRTADRVYAGLQVLRAAAGGVLIAAALFAVALMLSGCVSTAHVQASCDATAGDFGVSWSCARAKLARSPAARLYVARGDVIAEQWRRGAITTAEARLLLAQAGAQADAEAAAEAEWRAAKISQGLAQIGAARSQPQPAYAPAPQPTYAPPPVFSLSEPQAPQPTIWRPRGFEHLNH